MNEGRAAITRPLGAEIVLDYARAGNTWNRTASIACPDNPNGENVPYFYDFRGLPERVHGTDDQLEVAYASAVAYDKIRPAAVDDQGGRRQGQRATRAGPGCGANAGEV